MSSSFPGFLPANSAEEEKLPTAPRAITVAKTVDLKLSNDNNQKKVNEKSIKLVPVRSKSSIWISSDHEQSASDAKASHHQSPSKPSSNLSNEQAAVQNKNWFDIEKGYYVREKLVVMQGTLQAVREYGIIDALVMIQIFLAIFLLFSSMALGVIGASGAFTWFMMACLVFIPLVPTILLLSVGSPHASLSFSVMSHISAALNIFWTLMAIFFDTFSSGGIFIILTISLIQYACVYVVVCLDNDENLPKSNKKPNAKQAGQDDKLEEKKSPKKLTV